MVIKGAGFSDTKAVSVDATEINRLVQSMTSDGNIISRQNVEMDELSVRNYREYVSENGNIYEQVSTVLEYKLEQISSKIQALADVIEEDVAKKKYINDYAAGSVGGIR